MLGKGQVCRRYDQESTTVFSSEQFAIGEQAAKPQTCECRLHGLEGFSLQRVRFPRTRHLSRDRSFKEFVLNNILVISAVLLSQYFCRTRTYLVSSRLADTVGLPPVLGHLVVDQRDNVRSHRRPVNEPLE